MKTLHLHIGTPKTATSTIQAFLKKNADRLREYNYCFPLMPFTYPGKPIQRNGHFLLFTESSVKNMETLEPKARWKENFHTALTLIHREFKTCDNVILTEENLWNGINYTPKSFLDLLPEDAAANGYRIHVIVYLRRQDLFLTSLWNQKIKIAHTGDTLPEYLENLAVQKPMYADYEKTLQKVADVIGRENITVRRFEPSSWVGQSIVKDFLTAVGLDPELPFLPAKRVINLSLNGNAIEIQRAANKCEFLSQEERLLLSSYIKSFPESTDKSRAFQHLTVEESRAFLANFKEANDRVAAAYIGDGKPMFSDEIREEPLWQPDNEYAGSDAIQILLAVMHDLYTQNQELSETSRKRAWMLDKARHPVRTIKNKIIK